MVAIRNMTNNKQKSIDTRMTEAGKITLVGDATGRQLDLLKEFPPQLRMQDPPLKPCHRLFQIATKIVLGLA